MLKNLMVFWDMLWKDMNTNLLVCSSFFLLIFHSHHPVGFLQKEMYVE